MTSDAMISEIFNSLGRLEGTQQQILDKITQHADDDKDTFKAMSARFDAQDQKIASMKSEQDRAKGAGTVILGLFGSLAAFVGAAVIAAFEGWIKVRFHG